MKRFCVFIACFAFLASLGFSSEEGSAYRYSYARLSFVKGDVFIERAGDMGYEEGVVNLLVVEGDKLGTREGRAEIHFGHKNYIRIDSYTQLDFVGLPRRGDDTIKLNLLSGSIFLRMSYIDEDMSFGVHTPDGSFYLVEEGLYRFNVRENRETELLVYEGAVEAAGEEGSLLVESEQKLIVSNGHFSSDPVGFYARLDDSFSEWNKERDDLHLRPAKTNYLPSELNEYEDELADNGRWVNERPYGYVWVPYVVNHDWRPYYYGRWSWYPFIGWTWVSYDPWGWCVTHYGRWHWRWNLGWYWIPTRVWGPAWVHWCWGSHYVGWCPLSYYGYPVVIVNNYFYGRHYGRHYPAHSRALTMVRKDQLQAPRISRVALNKDRISRIGKISLSAKQPSVRPRIGSTSLRDSTAAKVLSRDNLRSVERNYVSTSRLSSRPRSTGSVGTPKTLRRSSSTVKRESLKENPRRITGANNYSRNSSRAQASSLRKTETPARSSSRVSKSGTSEPNVKTYPSRRRTVSRSSAASSSGRSNPASPRERSARVGKSGSKVYPSRLKADIDSRRSRNSAAYPSRSPTVKRSSASRAESPSARNRVSRSSSSLSSSRQSSGRSSSARIGTSKSSASRSAVRRSSSSSSRSRSVSSRKSSGASSRVSSSRSGRSSSSSVSRSSGSRSSRSSSRSSSSRSSSGRGVRKK